MTVAYCTLEDVKTSLSGDVPNLGASHDQSLVNKILETSRDLDRIVAKYRGDDDASFSFLAEQQYGRQRVYLSSAPKPTSGSFVLSFGGEITLPILFDATGADVQVALEALATIGSGNVSVSGFQGGPWTVDFDGTLKGPQDVLEGQSSTDVVDASVVVLPMIDGVETVGVERKYSSVADAYGKILPIDDCVEIFQVVLYEDGDEIGTPLSNPADYREYPLRGLPIQGIKSTGDNWPCWPAVVGVSSRWGHRVSIPYDVREGVTIETIRLHFAGIAGNDDRLGMTPFGKIITAKAYTSRFLKIAEDYGHSKLW